jgi:hypothetical protein
VGKTPSVAMAAAMGTVLSSDTRNGRQPIFPETKYLASIRANGSLQFSPESSKHSLFQQIHDITK